MWLLIPARDALKGPQLAHSTFVTGSQVGDPRPDGILIYMRLARGPQRRVCDMGTHWVARIRMAPALGRFSDICSMHLEGEGPSKLPN